MTENKVNIVQEVADLIAERDALLTAWRRFREMAASLALFKGPRTEAEQEFIDHALSTSAELAILNAERNIRART